MSSNYKERMKNEYDELCERIMFMFKRLKECLCLHNYEPVGFFYKESLAKYSDGFDKVNVYKKCKCSKCSKINNVLISSDEFRSEKYGCNGRKLDYMYNLKRKGIKQEVDLYL